METFESDSGIVFFSFHEILCDPSLDFFVVVVALLFYIHGKHLRSCWDGQLT